MTIEVEMLPERYKQQIMEKLLHEKHPGTPPSKYRNTKTRVDGITFDSKKEADRYAELMQMLKAGVIHNLQLQKTFTLQEGFMTIDGTRVRPIRYVADFVYIKDGEKIIEDVKGVKTKEYELKKKMMLDHGYKIIEV